MKKFILGVLVGISITAAGSAYADDIVESIVGKQVQGSFPVKVDGKQLSTVAAVIDGTSYLPVRAVGEALNKEVTFDADLGIELKEKGVTPVEETVPQPTPTTVPIQTGQSIQSQIDELKVKIENEKSTIESNKINITVNENLSKEPNTNKEMFQNFIKMYNDAIKSSEARIAEYEAQITALEAQK